MDFRLLEIDNWFMLSVRIPSYGCTREVWRAREKRKGDLHGTTLAYDCRMRFLLRALLTSSKNRMRLPRYKIVCRHDFRRVLKHVSKAHDILRVVRDNPGLSQASCRFDLQETTRVLDSS